MLGFWCVVVAGGMFGVLNPTFEVTTLADAAPAVSDEERVERIRTQSISLRDSFPIGSGAGILCSATTSSADKALVDMFDRAYSVVCRDAAVHS